MSNKSEMNHSYLFFFVLACLKWKRWFHCGTLVQLWQMRLWRDNSWKLFKFSSTAWMKVERYGDIIMIVMNLLRLLRHLPFQSNPFLNSCPTHIPFQNTLAGISKLLDMSEDLIDILVKKELVEWQRRQQKACIGALDSVCLNQLENWYVDVNINWFLLFCILCCKWLLYPLLLLLDLSATAHLAPLSQMCR